MASGGYIRPEVAVVTATTGRETLKQTVDSVKAQTVPCRHYIFIDGPQVRFKGYYGENLEPLDWCFLPVQTGLNGMMNGGIVAASAFLVEEPLICWLDDDNWFEPNHIEKLLEAKGDKPYAHSLRTLHNPDGSYFDVDDCESLGSYSGFVDLNCYLMDRSLAVQLAPLWYRTTGSLMVGDRFVYQALKDNKVEYGESGQYSLHYRLSEKRDLRAFFFENNIKVRAQFSGDLPWKK